MKKLILKIAVLFVILSQNSYSEDKTFGIGFTYGHFWAINDVEFIQNSNASNVLDDFTNQSNYYGLTYEVKIPFLKDFSLMTNLYYNSFEFEQSKDGVSYPTLIYDDNGNPIVVNSKIVHSVKGNYSLFDLDILSKYKIFNTGLSLFAGVSISKYESSKYENTMNIVSKDAAKFVVTEGYVYRNDRKTLVLYDDKIPNYNSFRFGLKVGASYDFNLYLFTISPYMNYDFALTELASKYTLKGDPFCYPDLLNPHWKVHYLNIGIDFKYWL
jgi:hypothetical protein